MELNERLREVARLLVEAKETPARETDARTEMTVTQALMLNDAYILAKAALEVSDGVE